MRPCSRPWIPLRVEAVIVPCYSITRSAGTINARLSSTPKACGLQKKRTLATSDALLGFARLDPRAFNQLCHPWHVGGKQARVGLGCQLVVGEWQGSEFFQLLPQGRIGQSRAERAVERDDDFLWRALCHVEPMPHRIADFGHAEFCRRRHVLQLFKPVWA